MAVNKLTALQVTRAKRPGYYGDGGGLWLRVGPNGAKSWVYRFKVDGRQREMGLGSLNAFTLSEARERARAGRQLRADRRDPIEERRNRHRDEKLAAARTMTFRQCAEAYIKAHQASWKNDRHAHQWPATLAVYVYPIIGDLPVADVDTDLVQKVLSAIWYEKPETASRVRGRIESVLDWATISKYRQGDNPARWKGHLEHLLPKKTEVHAVEHHVAQPYTEIAGVMSELRQRQGTASCALEFLILTAARTGEVIGAKWGEIDDTERLWTVPAERMKAGKEHRVPLSEAALAVIEKMKKKRDGDFVFPGLNPGRPLSDIALLALLRRMGHSKITTHGFRSSFRDWAAEQTSFPPELAEMALAHSVGDAVERSYRRSTLLQKRRQLMDAWGRYCGTPSTPAAANVTPIRKAS